MVMQYALNDDVTLKIASYLDLSSILWFSRTCQSLYRLSLSSLSFWINAVDAHQFPVSISTIRDHFGPEDVRYMARVIACYQQKIKGGQTRRSDRGRETPGVGLSSTTRIKFRQDGLVRLSSKGQEGLLGVSSAMVQGYTPDSLPWLISVKSKTIRCDSIDEGYVTGVEWEADGLVDWFWKHDVLTERNGGKLREYVMVTFLTDGAVTNLLQSSTEPPRSYQETLHAIKIYLPSKAELVPVPKTTSYLGVLGTLISSTPSVVQYSSTPPPRVVHHDSVTIPKGFNCGLCRPATDGSLVYLLARTRQRFALTLTAYVFWVFVYDWKTGCGLRIRLPEEGSWRKIAGSGHTVILQDWRDTMYTMDLSSEFTIPRPVPEISGDEDPPLPWVTVSEGPATALAHMPFRHQEEANLMPITGNIFQTTGESFCLISRLGERLYCHLFKRSPVSSSERPPSPQPTPVPGFLHIGTGYIDIDGEDQLGISFLHKTRGTRSLLGYSGDDGLKRSVHFFVVDFDIDCNQDGTDELQSIRGRKQELLVRGEAQGQSSGPSHQARSSSSGLKSGPKVRGLDNVLGRNNMQEVFYDGFRGTVGMVNKEYTEIVLLRTTRD